MVPLPVGAGSGVSCLRRNVSRPEAMREFERPGALFRLAHGPLRSLAEVYIPYRLYRVEIRDARTSKALHLAIDAVRAGFDLYSFPGVLGAEELEKIETRNRPAPAVSEERCREAIVERARRLAYEKGIFHIQDLRLSAEPVLDFHVPYWAGFFGRGAHASQVLVLDAVRRRLEGAKICAFVREWLGEETPR